MKGFLKGLGEALALVLLFSVVFVWLHVLGADPVPGASELPSRP